MANNINNTSIDFIIGLPPDNLHEDTNTVIRNSMPIVKISPGVPSFTGGITLFNRRPLFTGAGKNKNEISYSSLLQKENFTLNQYSNQGTVDGGIMVAFQADSFPTDSFTNEYGENFLQSFTDVASEKAASLMQMMGASNADQALNRIMSGAGKSGGVIGKGLEAAYKTAKKTLGGFLNTMPGGKSLTGGLGLVSSLAAGSRIDFPMLWKSSGFQPSYTMTVRLYNPNPANEESTKKYIIGPIAALMLLGIPISRDGKTYSWPFIHKIQSPGIYDLDPAFISNITVIKGGDQQQISYQQRMSIVDVRIDFGSLYNSILAGRQSTGRPTLTSYLNSMKTEKSGIKQFSSLGQTSEEVIGTQATQATSLLISKDQAPTATEITDEEKQNPPNRVSQVAQDIADSLINQLPRSLRVLID